MKFPITSATFIFVLTLGITNVFDKYTSLSLSLDLFVSSSNAKGLAGSRLTHCTSHILLGIENKSNVNFANPATAVRLE